MEKENQMKEISESGFSQSQGHGLYWDSQIREKAFGLGRCVNDTKKHDIDWSENKLDASENVSLKTSGGDSIGCGDIMRFFDADFSKKYTIILIRYAQRGAMKKIHEIVEIRYDERLRSYLFGSASLSDISAYASLVRSIPPGKASAEDKKAYKDGKKALQSGFGMKITVNPKVDGKAQRRVQCTISFKKLEKEMPGCIISRTPSAEVRGVQIDSEIHSPARKRNKKNKEALA